MMDAKISQIMDRVDALLRVGEFVQAESLCRQILAANPQDSQVHQYFGAVLLSTNRLDEAIAEFQQAIRLEPTSAAAYNNLGGVLHKLARYEQAIAASRQAVAIDPAHVGALNNLGLSLFEIGQREQAVSCFERAIALQPNSAAAIANLGMALGFLGRPDEALALCRRALAINPNAAGVYNTLGNIQKDCGELDEAIASYRAAARIAPNWSLLRDNLLYALHFHPRYDRAGIRRELASWNEQFARPLAKFIAPHENNRDPARKLRIGYISPDFRDHCQAFFTIPLLSHHDRDQFEIICYADVAAPDALTARIRGYADVWRDIVGLPDEQLVQQVRQDRIDILIDLTMHMNGSRLLAFARKPAPVQFTWLAYPDSTGLETIDYRITDPYLDPPGCDESYYSESSLRLAHSFWCYDPLNGEPAVNSLPAMTNGFVTFGCLNSFAKVNDAVIQLWAKVLQAVPNTRMLILCDKGAQRQRTLDSFANSNIDPSRIEFIARQSRPLYLATYHRIDLALDTFPYNGHTTSLDAMWMGVPTITLAGDRPVGRAGWSQLSNMALTELAARTSDDFVRIATDLARDLRRLSELRATLRKRMEASPLMNSVQFARDMENLYRTTWRRWCET